MANFKLWRLITVINGKMKTFRRKLSVKLFFETPSGDEQLCGFPLSVGKVRDRIFVADVSFCYP